MALHSLQIKRQEILAGGREFGEHGVFSRIDATAHYQVDPSDPANKDIVDLALAADDDGLVRFSGDVCLVMPENPGRGNRTLLVEAPNRGNRTALRSFNGAPVDLMPTDEIRIGDGFLMEQGFALAWCGWQWDVPQDGLRLGLRAPLVPHTRLGAPLQMQLRIQADRTRNDYPLTDHHVGAVGNHVPIAVAPGLENQASLWVRDHLRDRPTRIERGAWRFARQADQSAPHDAPGNAPEPIDDPCHVWLADGFEPGRIYDLLYTPARCPVTGAGLLALRDLTAWCRHATDSPLHGRIDRTIGEGISQCGRLLRTFLWLGLNRDEQRRKVFDGLLVHIAGGRRGEFNHRYAQPSVQPTPSAGHLFPFADQPQTDPRSGREAGLLDRLRATDELPKIVYTDTASEYWRGDASLTHTRLGDGPASRPADEDLQPPDNVRRYLFAGTQHSPGVLPFTDDSVFGTRTANWINVVDYRPLFRAALLNLHHWLAAGIEPPPSRFPRRADGTAMTREAVLERLARIGPIALPDPARLPCIEPLDLGVQAERGLLSLPATPVGPAYPCVVSAVDEDGNETGGLRMPDLSVPVATHTGFNPRHVSIGGAGQLLEYLGASVPFARSRAERDEHADRRASVTERYASRDAYLARVLEAAQTLVEQRYLLASDVDECLRIAAERYDAVMAARP
ncbi:MAG: hypothetical protein KDK91_26900 [Gammaproteobacteria bacterium]|nr:hypothetical protein [Gammaproteobacteria bacterium]